MQQAVYKVRTAGTAHATALYTLAQSCIFCCSQGQGAGTWGLESGHKERQLLAVKRQPARMGVRSSTTGNVPGRSPGPQRSRIPLLSDPKEGDCHFSPLPQAPVSMDTRRGTSQSRLACPAHHHLCPCLAGQGRCALGQPLEEHVQRWG